MPHAINRKDFKILKSNDVCFLKRKDHITIAETAHSHEYANRIFGENLEEEHSDPREE